MKLEEGKCYEAADGSVAKILAVGVKKEGLTCIGYWVSTGDADSWTDGGANIDDEFPTSADLKKEVSCE